jgi:hypothetical protein
MANEVAKRTLVAAEMDRGHEQRRCKRGGIGRFGLGRVAHTNLMAAPPQSRGGELGKLARVPLGGGEDD